MGKLFKSLILIAFLCLETTAIAAPEVAGQGIQWYQGTVAQGFAEAKASHKPVFLYWGAVWCPPCNQLKATLFKNPAFIRKTALFVPVYLDGDTEAAQKLGEDFGVLGYPTLILFDSNGQEITRLPGGMSMDLYPQMLDLALAKTKPVATLVKEILQQHKQADRAEWHMLAYYSWDQDAGRALGDDDLTGVLKTLAEQIPPTYTKERVRLDAAYLSALANRQQPPSDAEKRDALERLLRVLSLPETYADNFNFLIYELETLIPRITDAKSPQGQLVLQAWERALQQLAQDKQLNPAQKLLVYAGKIHQLKVAKKQLPDALKKAIRDAVSHARKIAGNGHERIAVNYAAYGILKSSGQLGLAEQLITEEMQAGSNNQYWMLVLADLAAEAGNEAEALTWYAKAWETSTGTATRIQWGSYYIRQLTEQTPDDDEKIIEVTERFFSQLAKQKTPFHGRSRRALERVFKALNSWGQVSSPAELIRLKSAFIKVCMPFGKEAISRCEVIMKTT